MTTIAQFIQDQIDYETALDTIHYLESRNGTDQNAFRPNPETGALGEYQITPIGFADLKRVYPQKYGNRSFEDVSLTSGREGARDLLNINAGYLRSFKIPFSYGALLGAYHSGIGNIRRNTIGPRGRAYIETGARLIREKQDANLR